MAPPNVIIFGETAAGKSSLVNLIAGTDFADTSNGAARCTFQSSAYDVSIDDTMFKVHDTAGLDEGQAGSGNQRAIVRFYELLRKLEDGISLYAPKAQGVLQPKLAAFICQRHVPILLAITGLELEEDMDAWWVQNQENFENYRMYPNGIASCIFIIQSERSVTPTPSPHRRVERAEWFKTIVEVSVNVKGGKEEIKNCGTEFGSATRELIDRKLMTKEEAEELAQA